MGICLHTFYTQSSFYHALVRTIAASPLTSQHDLYCLARKFKPNCASTFLGLCIVRQFTEGNLCIFVSILHWEKLSVSYCICFFLKLLFVSLVVRLVVNRQLHRNRNAWFFSIVTWDSKLIIGLNDKQFLHVFGGTHLQDCFQLVRRARDLVCFSRGTYSTPPRTNMGSLETEIPMDCQGPCYFLGV